ncbi:DUF4391 domain-containing protein [Corynebacterium phoceense]
MADIRYHWPESTVVGKRIPKEKFYEHGKSTSVVRQRFVSELAAIVWANKLTAHALHVHESTDFTELQVFRLELKGASINHAVLQVIDQSIPYPILFELQRDHNDRVQTRLTAAYKERAGKLSKYYETEWASSSVKTAPLPTAIDLRELYHQIFSTLAGITIPPGTLPHQALERLTINESLSREITQLRRKVANEKQINRRVELNRTLRAKQTELSKWR